MEQPVLQEYFVQYKKLRLFNSQVAFSCEIFSIVAYILQTYSCVCVCVCVCVCACMIVSKAPSKDHPSSPHSGGVQYHAVNKGLGGDCECVCVRVCMCVCVYV